MHQASIFDKFQILIACIQIMYMYKLASRISINRPNLFVLEAFNLEVSFKKV